MMMGLPSTFTLSWLGVSSVHSWFMFVEAPPDVLARQAYKSPLFAIHLVAAYTMNLACMYNTLYTPKNLTGTTYSKIHRWIGRVSNPAGLVTAVTGVGLAVWPWGPFNPPRAFAVAVTVTGALQVAVQYMGTRAIQKYQTLRQQLSKLSSPEERQAVKDAMTVALNQHISYMLQLFVLCCGGPAMQNVYEALFPQWMPVGTPLAVPLAIPPCLYMISRMEPVYQRIYGTFFSPKTKRYGEGTTKNK